VAVDALCTIADLPLFGSRQTGCDSLRTLCRLATIERVAFDALGEFCPSIGARRPGQPQARIGVLNIRDNQRFRDELEQMVDDLAPRRAHIGRRHRGRAKREAGGKDRRHKIDCSISLRSR
jgi:hypothetical protein